MNDRAHAGHDNASTDADSTNAVSAEQILRQLVHDLRNPLNVLSQAGMLLEQVDDLETARTIHAMIRRQVEELTELLAEVDARRSK